MVLHNTYYQTQEQYEISQIVLLSLGQRLAPAAPNQRHVIPAIGHHPTDSPLPVRASPALNHRIRALCVHGRAGTTGSITPQTFNLGDSSAKRKVIKRSGEQQQTGKAA